MLSKLSCTRKPGRLASLAIAFGRICIFFCTHNPWCACIGDDVFAWMAVWPYIWFLQMLWFLCDLSGCVCAARRFRWVYLQSWGQVSLDPAAVTLRWSSRSPPLLFPCASSESITSHTHKRNTPKHTCNVYTSNRKPVCSGHFSYTLHCLAFSPI